MDYMELKAEIIDIVGDRAVTPYMLIIADLCEKHGYKASEALDMMWNAASREEQEHET